MFLYAKYSLVNMPFMLARVQNYWKYMNFKGKSNDWHNFSCVNVCVEFEFSNTQRDTQREPSLFCVVANTCQWVLPRTLRGCKDNGFGISLCKLPDSDLTICQTTIRVRYLYDNSLLASFVFPFILCLSWKMITRTPWSNHPYGIWCRNWW